MASEVADKLPGIVLFVAFFFGATSSAGEFKSKLSSVSLFLLVTRIRHTSFILRHSLR